MFFKYVGSALLVFALVGGGRYVYLSIPLKGETLTEMPVVQPAESVCDKLGDLVRGSRGADVVCLQNFLITNGYSIPAGATGYFGPQTEAAVTAWQMATGVTTTAQPTFNLGTVATHSDRASCWSAINGVVYDLTTWIDKHPGGANRILSICGKDGSSAFDNQHAGEPRPEAMLATFKLGSLK